MSTEESSFSDSGEDGENYFVSMTDMIVGVLFIFIIMLMVFALDFRSKTDIQDSAIEVSKEVAAKLADLRKEVASAISTLDDAQKRRQQLLSDLETQLKQQGLNVQVDEANGVLRLTEAAVRFKSDKSDLDDEALSNVKKIARVLDAVLPNYSACRQIGGQVVCRDAAESTIETVFIEGHTDVTGVKEPAERDRRNWELSTQRAVNTYRELVSQAPALRALENLQHEEIISVSGYSSTRPIDPSDDREAWAKNRRIDLRFVMEVNSRERLQEILKLTNDMRQQIEKLSNSTGR